MTMIQHHLTMQRSIHAHHAIRLLTLAFFLCFAPFSAVAQETTTALDRVLAVKGDSTGVKKKKYVPKINGVIQAHYLAKFNTNGDTIRDPGGFRILRARFMAKGKVANKVTYELLVDARPPEPRCFLRDAFIGLHHIKDHEVRIGQQKAQFGWENRQSITDLYTVNRAEMSDGVSRGENLRDIGIGIIGHIKLTDRLRIEDAVTFTNGTRSTTRSAP